MKFIPLVVITCFLAISAGGINVYAVPQGADNNIAKEQLRKNAQLQRALDRELAPVKSLQDFYKTELLSSRGMVAFKKLRPQEQADFISGLVFTSQGLASYNYRVVEDSLSVSEAYDLLGLFGVQYTIKHLKGLKVKNAVDLLIQQREMTVSACCDENEESHKGYRCESPGTCGMSQTHICTDNC